MSRAPTAFNTPLSLHNPPVIGVVLGFVLLPQPLPQSVSCCGLSEIIDKLRSLSLVLKVKIEVA